VFISSTQFYINTNLLILKNKIFLNQIQFKNSSHACRKNVKIKSQKSATIIKNENRKEILLSNINHITELQNSIEIIDNKTGEIKEVKNFNLLNRFKSKLLDNRFISLVLGREIDKSGLFITLTTKPLNNLNLEIEELEKIYKKIKKHLERKSIKFIKVYEFTKNIIPHIHILILDRNEKEAIKEILNKFDSRTLIQSIPKKEISKVIMYMTKLIEDKKNHLLY